MGARMKVFFAAVAISSAIALPAVAADLPNTKNAPVFTPIPASNWTGFYAGLNIGYGFSAGARDSGGQTYYNNTSGDTGTETHGPGGPTWNSGSSLNGVLGGGQIGYNYQFSSPLVAGIEADFQGAALSGSANATNSTFMTLQPYPVGGPNLWPVTGTANVSQHVDWFGTVRGRLGVTSFNNTLLVYGTGGLAYGRVQQDFTYTGGFLPDAALGFGGSHWNGTASGSEINIGWTAGAGFEWLLPNAPNWSVKAEYLYTNLGSTTVNLTAPAYKNSDGSDNRSVSASNAVQTQWHTVRVGLNYHFF